MSHLEDHGLDTITYIADPTDPTKNVSIVHHYGKFTRESGSEKGDDDKLIHFDSYALQNVTDAKKFLYNSVSDHHKKQLNQKCSQDCSFITYWLELIHSIQSTSMERFEAIKIRIKSRQPTDYEGENIEKLCTDFYEDFTILDNSSMYDEDLNLHMLDIGMAAGGENNEDYRFPLRMIRVNLEAALLQIRHMSYVESRQYLSSRKLDAESIINKLQDSYRTLYDNGRWPPAKDSKDSKAMNHSYGRVNLAATNELRNVVNSLIQS